MTQELQTKLNIALRETPWISEESFEQGVHWLLNNLWHDASEKPEWDSMIIVERNLEYEVITYIDITYWDDVLRWCYLKDILPTKKGGSKWR
jgi:hypothetical protein